MNCYVYKSSTRADTYVFLRERDATGLLPHELVRALGTLVFVMELAITPGRRLARIDAEDLRTALVERGFHIQFPPDDHPHNAG
ncbi:MAG TPA: YcgL domain-containing protein [Dokdonella sp.]